MYECSAFAGGRWAAAAERARRGRHRAGRAAAVLTYQPPRAETLVVDGVAFVLRAPRLSDAPSWRRVRLAERAALEPVLGRSDVDWVSGQGELVWVERCLRLRRAQAQARAWAGVLARSAAPAGAPSAAVVGKDMVGDAVAGEEVVGEVGVDGIDRRTATGELSVWAAPSLLPDRVLTWACATTVLRAFEGSRPLARMVMPVAHGNDHPVPVLRALGFGVELTLRGHRRYDGIPTDHDLWVLHNSPKTRARSCERVVHWVIAPSGDAH